MATHASILPWEIPWTDKPGGLVPGVAKQLDTTEQLSTPGYGFQSLDCV